MDFLVGGGCVGVCVFCFEDRVKVVIGVSLLATLSHQNMFLSTQNFQIKAVQVVKISQSYQISPMLETHRTNQGVKPS